MQAGAEWGEKALLTRDTLLWSPRSIARCPPCRPPGPRGAGVEGGHWGPPPRRKGESVAEWDTSLRIPTASAASLAGSAATASSQPGGFTGGGGETQRSPPPSKNQPNDPKGDVRGKRRSEPLFLPVG